MRHAKQTTIHILKALKPLANTVCVTGDGWNGWKIHENTRNRTKECWLKLGRNQGTERIESRDLPRTQDS